MPPHPLLPALLSGCLGNRLAGSGEQWVPLQFLGPCPFPPPTLTLLSLAPPPAQAKPKGAGLLYHGREGLSSLLSLLWTFSLGRWLREGVPAGPH